MERKDAIEILTDMYNYYSNTDDYGSYVPFDKEDKEALEMAINSLKTDEAYQLEYELTTKNDLGVECISRDSAIKALPSVTPQEPRKGHWTEEFNDLEGEVRFTCSSCGKYQLFETDFCYHCGSDNREVVEE